LIVIGSLMSFGREYLSEVYVRLHGWLRKQTPPARVKPAVTLYLMITGMVLTVLGVLRMLGVLRW